MVDRVVFYGNTFLEIIDGKAVAKIHLEGKDMVAQLVWEGLGDNHKNTARIRVVFYRDEEVKEDWLNRYYWTTVLPMATKGANDLGNEWDMQRMHKELKRMFTPNNTTKDLGKDGFRLYVNKCIRFAAEFLSVNIPECSKFAQIPDKVPDNISNHG